MPDEATVGEGSLAKVREESRPRVFLTAARSDVPSFKRVASIVLDLGAEIATPADISPGERFTQAIARQIEEADAAIVIVSSDTSYSATTSAEAAFAVAKALRDPSFRVLPVVIGSPDRLPAVLSEYQSLHAGDQEALRAGLRRFLEELAHPRQGDTGGHTPLELDRQAESAVALEREMLQQQLDVYRFERERELERQSLQFGRLASITFALTVLVTAAAGGYTLIRGEGGIAPTFALLASVLATLLTLWWGASSGSRR